MNQYRLFLASVVFFLFTISSGQTGEAIKTTDNDYEFFSSNEEIKKKVGDIANLINENRVTVFHEGSDGVFRPWGLVKDFRVLEDRIEFSKGNPLVVMFFKDIFKNYAIKTYGNGQVGVLIGYYKPNRYEILIRNEGGRKLSEYLKQLKKLNDELFTKKILEEQNSDLVAFEPMAAQYRDLKVKPPVSEEQRRYIVQANSFNQKKEYTNAIELYKKAIEIDQTAYPSAYSNMALLSAQIRKFSDAIYYMKKYLMLEPEAPDSRGAMDKIYEWEAELAKD